MNEIAKFCILDEQTKFTILDEIRTKIGNLEEFGDFGRTKNDILDTIFLVSLNILVAQYKISIYSFLTSITSLSFT